jgi:hypothetical protein
VRILPPESQTIRKVACVLRRNCYFHALGRITCVLSLGAHRVRDAGRGISFVQEPRTGLLHARPPFDDLVAGGDLLHGPTVAVGVGEEDETDVV